jgi:hypothetical protein
VPHSHLGAVPLLVSAPCTTSDKASYVALGVISKTTGSAKPMLGTVVALVQQPDSFRADF